MLPGRTNAGDARFLAMGFLQDVFRFQTVFTPEIASVFQFWFAIFDTEVNRFLGSTAEEDAVKTGKF